MKTRERPQVIRPRIRLGEAVVVGPGKIELLRAIVRHGSISAASRALGMTYKRAWSLLNEVNLGFGVPVITSLAGGSGGGGATITPFGKSLLEHYDAMEAACTAAADPHLKALRRALARHSE